MPLGTTEFDGLFFNEGFPFSRVSSLLGGRVASLSCFRSRINPSVKEYESFLSDPSVLCVFSNDKSALPPSFLNQSDDVDPTLI